MPVGAILLMILLVLLLSGFLTEALASLGLTRTTAALLTAIALLGSAREIGIAPGLSISIGGGIVPIGVALWLLARRTGDPLAALIATALTTTAVAFVGRWFPPGVPTELNLFHMDAQYLFAAVAAITACLTGRLPGPAFCAATLGTIGAEFVAWVTNAEGQIRLGGGALNGPITAGVAAMLLTGLFWEEPLTPIPQIDHNEQDPSI